jgi:FAD-dependent urate hydroxylase
VRVTIIGAGIGGLTAAIALRRIGLDVRVFERAPRLGEVGAGITLWPNATRILFDLGVAAIEKRSRRLGSMEIRSSDGRLLSRTTPDAIEEQLGAPAIALHRADLHAALVDALPREIIHLGAERLDVEGELQSADLVIGADGIRSSVRGYLFPDVRPRYAGYTGWRAITNHSATQVIETWGRGARFGIVPIGDGRVYWYATQNAKAGATTPLPDFSEWHAPIAELVASTPAESILQNDIYDIEPMPKWSRGRVMLLGDSAHATTPNLGQGACMAIESAAVLAEELASRDVDAAIEAYEQRRIPRTARIATESWRIGSVGQLEGTVACAMRNFVARMMPASLTEKRLAELIAMPI